VETPAVAAKLASLVNDEFREAMDTRGKHFIALATLPLNDPRASAKELERALTELKMPGAMLFSNVNGVALADDRFLPMYEVANEHGAVMYIHPEHPLGVEAMLDYWLMPLVGFLMDTTLAAAKIVFSGIPERYPKIKWALCHLGGTIPYLAERLDRGFHAFKDCRAKIDREPSSYLKHFYYDTVNFNQGALKLAIDFAGADHILAGSDYPHKIGSIPSMLDAIAKLPVTEEQRAGIYGGNAAKLLGLPRA
jgi:aminocarboxymuconate-semialdehyde decarboxylase